jgi:hypothetical protein
MSVPFTLQILKLSRNCYVDIKDIEEGYGMDKYRFKME